MYFTFTSKTSNHILKLWEYPIPPSFSSYSSKRCVHCNTPISIAIYICVLDPKKDKR